MGASLAKVWAGNDKVWVEGEGEMVVEAAKGVGLEVGLIAITRRFCCAGVRISVYRGTWANCLIVEELVRSTVRLCAMKLTLAIGGLFSVCFNWRDNCMSNGQRRIGRNTINKGSKSNGVESVRAQLYRHKRTASFKFSPEQQIQEGLYD